MKFKTGLLVAKSFMKLILLGKRTPLLVGWALTNRCNLRCRYCNAWNFEFKELTTKQIFSILDELARLGCARIAFTGGEPLLRNDVGDIVSYSKNKGIHTGINSNGILITKKIDQIKNIDQLMLSLDGPQEIHDFLRGSDSYKNTIQAMEIAKNYDIKIAITTVLTKHNLNYIDFILEKAKLFNSYVLFQPVTNLPLGARDLNSLLPSQEEFKISIDKLLKLKSKNNFIGNSKVALKHFLNWPDYKRINCKIDQIYCAIDPGGFLYACSTLENSAKFNILKLGFKKALNNLRAVSCGKCWCSTPLEINKLLSFNINTILNILKTQV